MRPRWRTAHCRFARPTPGPISTSEAHKRCCVISSATSLYNDRDGTVICQSKFKTHPSAAVFLIQTDPAMRELVRFALGPSDQAITACSFASTPHPIRPGSSQVISRVGMVSSRAW